MFEDRYLSSKKFIRITVQKFSHQWVLQVPINKHSVDLHLFLTINQKLLIVIEI